MTRHFRPFIVPCIVLVSILGALLLGILRVSMPAYDATPSVDTQVVIAVDVTDQSCFKKTARTLNGLHTSAPTPIPCPAGTVIQSVIVPLSEAKADHEAYVTLPSGKASQSFWQETNEQISWLLEAKRSMIQHVDQRSRSIPNNDCGEYNEFGTYPTVFGDSLYVAIDYQISYSCNNLVLDQTKVYGLTSPNSVYFYQWNYANDAGRYWPDCYFTGTNHWNIPINHIDPIGYYFVWHFTYPYCIGSTTTVSLGPLV